MTPTPALKQVARAPRRAPETKLRPYYHRLYVEVFRAPEEEQTAGGLIITRRAREAELETGLRARVVAVGPGCDPLLAPGMWILVPRFTGTAVDLDTRYIVVSEDSIIGILDTDEVMRELGFGDA